MPITPLIASTISLTPGGQTPSLTPPDATSASASGFGASLKDMISNVDGTANDANDAVGKMLDGTGDVHEAMIALQRADLMLQLTVQVRNKLVQAYQDVMRMPI
jgi:flagellar hook-basal body complex protein FliE